MSPRPTTSVLLFMMAGALLTVGAVAAQDPIEEPTVPNIPGQGQQQDQPTPPPPNPVDDGGTGVADFLADGGFLAGLGIGLAAAAGLAWLMFSGGAKFVTADNVLENETRYNIYHLLRDHPGSHLREIASTLDLSTTNALWHLRKLQDASLINSKKVDGYKVFYPIDDGIEGKKKALAMAALKKDNARAILETVAENPGTHQREMAREIGVNHGTVRWHLKKMVKAGLVIQMKRDHATQYYLTELGTSILADRLPAVDENWTPPEAHGPGVAEA